jgi:hypothetical protein
MAWRLPLDRLAGLLFVLALHAAAVWGLWQHRLIPSPLEAATLFVNFIAPPAPLPAPAPVIEAPPMPLPTGPVALSAELSLACPERSAPAYPTQSRRFGETGVVVLHVELDESGRVAVARVSSSSGHARLDEAALGLAVAIPAVLAYNAFNRRNRMWLSRLESIAHDLYVLLTVKHGQG